MMYKSNDSAFLNYKITTLRKFGLLLISALLITSVACEDVIEIDLDGVEPRVIIEGTITDQPGPYYVLITESTDYFNPSDFPPVSGAVVTVSDDSDNTDTFEEILPGLYASDSLEGVPGRTYSLSVTIENETYEAISTMPRPLEIDSLGVEYQPGDSLIEEDEGYILHCYFQDPADRDDYARIKIHQNNILSDNMYLYDGDWSDGNYFDYNYFWEVYDFADTVDIAFRTINHETMIYYFTLMEIVASEDGEMPHGVPANPATNLSNGALGYFATYTLWTDSLVMPDGPE
ncbi:MAG: DUF4249 domain-containing protein [candidate division Zixibacteria bacterium]|nr:DUF4249 domain-containing protein [candidate division Zixibacteria bacterium]